MELGPLKDEGYLRIDPIVLDLIVLNRGLELAHVNGADAAHRLACFCHGLTGSVFPAFLRLGEQLEDFGN